MKTRTGRIRYVNIPDGDSAYLVLQVEEVLWSNGWVFEWRFATSADVFAEVITLA